MKKIFTLISCLFFMITMIAQNKFFEPEPKGIVFVPAGTFQMKVSWVSSTKMVNVSVEAFWMSNEITNGEYREFIDWAKSNPDKKLYQTKYSQERINDPKKGIMKDTVIVKIIPIDVSTLIPEMIDPSAMERVNSNYKNYFDDKKYNDYPVVGVSFKLAEYYCIWKTMLENKQLKEKGLPNIHLYRIPLESEWEYAAQQPSDKKIPTEDNKLIQKVNEGNPNVLNLFHFDDNVSEWVVASPKEKDYFVRGGSWKTDPDISLRTMTDPDCKEGNIGFRIVRSYLATKPYDRLKTSR
jgi:formylglycine-generating enzyme required for sulfatase activity